MASFSFSSLFSSSRPSSRVYKTKAGAQDAHEAIRPSDVNLTPEQVKKDLTPDVGKQAHRALPGDVHALVELLGNGHGPPGGHAQLPAGLQEYWSLDAKLSADGTERTAFLAHYHGENGKKKELNSLEEVEACMRNLTVQVEMTMDETDRSGGTFRCSVLPESYDAC